MTSLFSPCASVQSWVPGQGTSPARQGESQQTRDPDRAQNCTLALTLEYMQGAFGGACTHAPEGSSIPRQPWVRPI